MTAIGYRFFFTTIFFCILAQTSWAAPTPALQNIRYFAAKENVRVVLDLDAPVQYTASQQDDLLNITLELAGARVKPGLSQQVISDPAVAGIQVVDQGDNKKSQVIIDCRLPVAYKVFRLSNPNRVVIDITKVKEKKTEQDVAPGIRYISWYKPGHAGPLNIHILEVSPQSGYTLAPRLIKQNTLGIDPLSTVLLQTDVLAAVNASYFAPSGDIIGLLKIDDEVISSTTIARTALGIKTDGKMLIDQVNYRGEVEIPDYRRVPLSGVNEYRGENSLVLYNRYFGATTKTNSFGMEYTVVAGTVTAIQTGNSPIPANGYVLSAHGDAANKLINLKMGDTVTLFQTLGHDWDQVPQVVGAGPMLVKEGNVFLTTKLEEFGSDVAGGRAPRTAVAVTKDGRILLVVVDGRQSLSKGMSLLELALFLRELGAVNAMNLDGGGSSQMIVKGRIVNKPSEGKERRIGNALAVVPAKLAI